MLTCVCYFWQYLKMLALTEWCVCVYARAHAHTLNFVSNSEKLLLKLSRCYKKYLVMKLWVVWGPTSCTEDSRSIEHQLKTTHVPTAFNPNWWQFQWARSSCHLFTSTVNSMVGCRWMYSFSRDVSYHFNGIILHTLSQQNSFHGCWEINRGHSVLPSNKNFIKPIK